MFQFKGTISVPNNSPKTYAELIKAAIAARTYPLAEQETNAINRMDSCLPVQCFTKNLSGVTVYESDAYKGVLNGVVQAGHGLLAAELKTGFPFETGETRRVYPGTDLGATIVFQDSGAAVDIHIDLTIQ